MHTTALFCAAACVAIASASDAIELASFDGASGTTLAWTEMDDPVMGGQSKGSFTVGNSTAVFTGVCAIVPSLQAPGFCKAGTDSSLNFPDVSEFLDGGAMLLTVRSDTPFYKGFRLDFESKDMPARRHGFGSFKAHFSVENTTGWQTVKLPFSTFSSDWSSFTGACDTQDPPYGNTTGVQHHCCSKAHPEVCPTSSNLQQITELALWAEGAEGEFHLEVMSIAAGAL
jgi:hypothetical protein